MAAGGGALVSGCSLTGGTERLGFAPRPALAPLNISPETLMRVTVCTRPFRPAGPRLEAVNVGGRKVVHNYGHGGSGWSLSWGCAEEATTLALNGSPKQVAVIGAGVIGLTTALRLAENGAAVTVYANEFPAETRSARATGVWSPSSRIGLRNAISDGFADRWEVWARATYATHQHFVGAAGEPVEFLPQYYLSDDTSPPYTPATRGFVHIGSRVRDLSPPSSRIEPDAHPFPTPRASRWEGMVFNVTSYMDRLTRDYLLRGGKMVRRDFPNRNAILALSEPVIVNCTGYGAKDLWGDDSLAPVRGQINWMTPQSDARYGVYYNNVSAISRRDGIIVQYTGPNNDYGFGDESETADPVETTKAMTTLAPLFPSVKSESA